MRFTSFSDKGGAQLNTDSVTRLIQDNVCAFITTDGGAFCGDIVAPIVEEAIIESLKKDMRVNSAVLRSCFENAHKKLSEKAIEDDGFKNAAVSCAVLIIDSDNAIWGHIGNCRIYRLKSGRIKSVTADHTNAYRKYKNKEIEYDKIAENDNGDLIVSINALGSADADISAVERHRNSGAFLLCSDGFWKNISTKNILTFAKSSLGAKEWLSSMLSHIEKNANPDTAGISAITIAF